MRSRKNYIDVNRPKPYTYNHPIKRGGGVHGETY
nr:MAG TPA: hypothetical protein [Caudoviricetes sp.]